MYVLLESDPFLKVKRKRLDLATALLNNLGNMYIKGLWFND